MIMMLASLREPKACYKCVGLGEFSWFLIPLVLDRHGRRHVVIAAALAGEPASAAVTVVAVAATIGAGTVTAAAHDSPLRPVLTLRPLLPLLSAPLLPLLLLLLLLLLRTLLALLPLSMLWLQRLVCCDA